ncbi:MAG: 4-hydroxy-2-oxovalerate aldolase [bacterium]|nr:4-hydroxy-2-oxovalerate aldolase [bacterium]
MGLEHVEILDTTLRDGSYTIDFQFTAEDTALVASSLESAGIPLIEVGHGLGLGAARAGKGDQAASDEAYLRAAAGVLKSARFGAFFIPGVGEADDLRLAADCGMHFVRIGTNITELESAEPYVALSKQLGLIVSCNLMKSYAVSAEEFAGRARLAEQQGADIVCLVDSAGGMLPEEVGAYLESAKAAASVQLGFHGHDNLTMAVANTLAACDAGATILDASLQGIGRSEGNAVTEVLVALLQKRGFLTETDVHGLLDIAEAFIRPLMHERKRTGIGITTGRARFHSSFLGTAMEAAARHGIDVRELIVRLGAHDQVNAPAKLVESLARDIAQSQPRARVRVDIAATKAEVPEAFEDEVLVRARELKEKARKLGLRSVLNIVVSPYEMTRVSPFVETNYGCALSNIMIAEPQRLAHVLKAVDGVVDFVLLDSGREPVAPDALSFSVLLNYLDHEMWARATVTHLTMLLGGDVHGKRVALTGVPPLATRAAMALAEAGALVSLDPCLEKEASALGHMAPGVHVVSVAEAAMNCDAIVSLSPRRPTIDAACVAGMKSGALLYDGGIGSVHREAVPAAETAGVRVVRVDMRPSLAATALELIGTRSIVDRHMGRATWNGVSVVAGGLIGREGEVIVDSIHAPTRVIGIADGMGGILRPDADQTDVAQVRRAIAERLIQGTEQT